jgi:hypothetical protein
MQPTHIVDRDPHSDQAFAYFEFPYSFVLEEPEAYVEKWMWFLVGCSAQWSRARGGRLR